MRSLLFLGLASLSSRSSYPCVLAETTVAILEYGPGGAVHRTTSSSVESSAAAVSNLWDALHGPSHQASSRQHVGMPVVPDFFVKADLGVVLGLLASSEALKSMPKATSLLDAGAPDVVGHIQLPGKGARAMLLERSPLTKDAVGVHKEDIPRSLELAAEAATHAGMKGGIKALALEVDDQESAAIADEHISRLIKTLKMQADENGKTVVVHLIVEEGMRRRLAEDEDRDGEGQNQNQNGDANGYYQKTMYEIQTFNLFLWTAVGLVLLVALVIGAFIDMPLMPDTLLFGETAKMAGSD